MSCFFTVLGHTAVYHSSLNVVLVYGGFGYHPNGSAPSVSKAMLQIDLTHWHCSVLEPDRERAPSPVVSDVISVDDKMAAIKPCFIHVRISEHNTHQQR